MKKVLLQFSRLLIGCTFLIPLTVFSQTTLVAELGNPIDITGWTIVSGDMGGGYVDNVENSFVFTDDLTSQKGAIYYSTPYNLNQCNKWRIEFDFRIWGNGTPSYGHGDGLAFWYLENPPTEFVDGGGIGIPSDGKGIIVAFDTFDNATEGSQSEVQILYGQGYHETNNAADMYFFNTLPAVNVRAVNYLPAVIEWDNGTITVTINGVEICSFVPTPHDGAENILQGYFGFSSSTGAASDKHSIRNVKVLMDVVEVLTENPPDLVECDADGDGFAEFNLLQNNNLIINNPADYSISYFRSAADLALNNNPILTPATYTNEVAGSQTIYVKVANGVNCYDTAEFDIVVNSLPPFTTYQPDVLCDEDLNGMVEVNLNDLQADLITGNLLGVSFNFYTDAGLTDLIPMADLANYEIATTDFPFSIYVTIDKSFSNGVNCTSEIPYELIFNLGQNLPVNSIVFTIPETFCFAVGEPTIIDLTQIQNTFTNENSVDYIYYETETQAEIGETDFIVDPSNYLATGSGTVYVRLEKSNFCTAIIELNYEIGEIPDAEPQYIPLAQCDDDFDGQVFFNLDDYQLNLVDDVTGLTFTYYLSETDAETGNNPQSPNVSLEPAETIIYYVIISNGTCETISQIHLEASEGLNGLTDQTELDPIPVCDDDFDGIYTVNLTTSEALLITNSNGINFNYYAQAQDITDDNPIAANELNSYTITGNTTIWVMIDNGECSAVRTIDFIISPDVPHTTTPLELPAGCEETVINLTTIQPEITTDNTTEFSYYLTESDAQNEINPIPDPENFSTESSGTVYIRLGKEDHCPVVLPIEYELSPLPENPLTELPTLCPGESVTLNAGNEYPDANYVWTWEGGEFTGAEFTVTEPGNYVLTITSDNNCPKSFPFEIESPAQPIIANIEFGDTYIIVEAEGSGGLIEYSLNNVIWQTNPRFDNLIKGEEYIVYVRENGCEAAMKVVTFPMIPNFISPNGDGYNDAWTIRGIDFSEQSNVKIFDRYGKIFVDSTPLNIFVWSGKYLGRPVPSGDYWYIITTVGQNDISMKYVGHISVRNRD